jgi:hypothetical protein
MSLYRFKTGDLVCPRLEWKDDPNRIPAGTVRKIELWGDEGAIHVGAERRAFAAYVFELESEREDIQMARCRGTAAIT